MERVVGFLIVVWLALMAVGVIIALLPLIAFAAGFVGVLLIFFLLSRWVTRWFW